jgi:Phosphate-induced protein 1 conserved region/FG-GAP-like repeat
MKRLALCLLCVACQSHPLGPAESAAALLSYPANANGSVDYTDSTTSGVVYAGGADFTAPTVYFIFYGSWQTSQIQEFKDFTAGLSGSPLMNVLSTFANSAGQRVPSHLSVYPLPAQDASYAQGRNLSKASLAVVVQNAINGGLPYDTNGVYVVVLDETVNKSDGGFCCPGCAAHGPSALDPNLKIAWIGDPLYCKANAATVCPPSKSLGCTGDPATANGDLEVDFMVNMVWHELAESLTNPNDDATGFKVLVNPDGPIEIGDVCEGGYRSDKLAHAQLWPAGYDFNWTGSGGGPANIHLGSKDYLVQGVWQNADRGGCARRVALNRPVAENTNSWGPAGDFDHNGITDLLYRDSNTGDLKVSLLDSSLHITQTVLLGTFPQRQQIVAVADFNRDGYSDILWRDIGSGALTIDYFLPGGTSFSQSTVAPSEPPEVLVKAVGDFDGDGYADILFQDMLNNVVQVWLHANGGAPTWSTLPATTTQMLFGDDWESVGTGDFTGDGRSDVLWHDLSTDQYIIWSIAPNLSVTTYLITPGFTYLLGIVDVDRDGTADLLGMNVTAQQNGEPSNGSVVWVPLIHGAAQPAKTIHDLPTPNWRFSGSGRMEVTPFVPGENGVWWRDRQLGGVRYWILDSNGNITTNAALTTLGSNWELVAE